jgi:hypothetical protein
MSPNWQPPYFLSKTLQLFGWTEQQSAREAFLLRSGTWLTRLKVYRIGSKSKWILLESLLLLQ